MSEINDLVEKVHDNAKAKGWYDKGDRAPLEMHMLMITEIAEAAEEVRNGKPPVYANGHCGSIIDEILRIKVDKLKPEGEAVELADTVIRIMDYFGYKGWDIGKTLDLKMTYNETRSYRHGGKKH